MELQVNCSTLALRINRAGAKRIRRLKARSVAYGRDFKTICITPQEPQLEPEHMYREEVIAGTRCILCCEESVIWYERVNDLLQTLDC